MIFSENRYPLFGIMLQRSRDRQTQFLGSSLAQRGQFGKLDIGLWAVIVRPFGVALMKIEPGRAGPMRMEIACGLRSVINVWYSSSTTEADPASMGLLAIERGLRSPSMNNATTTLLSCSA